MKIEFPIKDANVRQAAYALHKKAEQGEIEKAEKLLQGIYDYGWGTEKTEGTLFVALKVFETLTLRGIQDERRLVYLLSKTSHLFLAKTHQDFTKTQKGITPLTRETMRVQLTDVFAAVPSYEVGIQFQLLCCEEVRKRLQPGKGLAQDIARCHGLSFVKGSLEAGAAMNPLPLVSPTIDLGVRAYQEIRHSWYSSVSRLHQLAMGVLNLEAFGNNLKNEISQNPKTVEQAFCITEIFMELIQHPKAAPDLKARVLMGNSPQDVSLQSLAAFHTESKLEKCGKILKIDLSWKVRYRAIELLSQLAQTSAYQDTCTQTLINCQIHEKNATIKILVLKGLNQMYASNDKEQDLIQLEETKKYIVEAQQEILNTQRQPKLKITKQGYHGDGFDQEKVETDKNSEKENLSYQLELLESEINNVNLQIDALKDISAM